VQGQSCQNYIVIEPSRNRNRISLSQCRIATIPSFEKKNSQHKMTAKLPKQKIINFVIYRGQFLATFQEAAWKPSFLSMFLQLDVFSVFKKNSFHSFP
jgi:hypothetical protein